MTITLHGFVYYLVLFSSAAVVLQAVAALDWSTWRTHHGVRLAFLGLACSAMYALLDCLYQKDLPTHALVAVLVAVSVFLAVDRRARNERRKDLLKRLTKGDARD